MMENKIPIFASLPVTELSKLSEPKTDTTDYTKLRSIEKEFETTNQHTKQTQETGNNTDATDTTGATGATSAKKNRLGKLMGGTFAVDLVDMLIPSLVVLLMKYLGYVMDKKDIQLNKSEKEALAPAVQDVLDEINIDFNNPYVNLGVMLAIVYGSKIMDKSETIKKKTTEKPVAKKGISEAIAEAVKQTGEAGEETSDIEKFEIDYAKMVDEIRISRKRGVGDAKQYLADNYNEKIKATAKKHGIPLSAIKDKLQYQHTVKQKKDKEQFNLD